MPTLQSAYARPSRRSVVMARRGMVATSQPLAAQAGLRMLLAGGNAVDAAVATAAVLNVVEPFSTGIGGDAFALVYLAGSGEVLALNASGRSPRAFTLAEARRRGLDAIPLSGGLPISVPGAVDGWETILARCGRMGLAEVLAPAIAYAEEGFPVSPLIAHAWATLAEKMAGAYGGDAFLIDGRAPRPGEIFRLPALGATLRAIAEGGRDAFYTGPIAEAMAAAAQATGGYLTAADLAEHRSTWETPIETSYRGVRVLECPPNGHGLVALLALNTLRDDDIAALGFGSVAALHLQIEALRLAFADGLYYVCDPLHCPAPLAELLSFAYGRRRRAQIDSSRAGRHTHGDPIHGDTVYLTTADAEGNMVSFINSLYYGFGSGVVAPGTGICLQNRGALFELDADHPNALAGGKRPYHTIIPAMALGDDGRPLLSFGVMGGFMQPQGHLQVIQNLLDFGMDPQQALDAPRFCIADGRGLVLAEPGLGADAIAGLASLGHEIREAAEGEASMFGGGQIIWRDPETGAYHAGSDPRKDGCAIGY